MGLFTTIIYQPFFNLLIGIYWLLDQLTNGRADMGTTVIIFTVIFRILWLPISFASGRTAKERHEISLKIAEAKAKYDRDPIRLKEELKKIMSGNRRIVIASGFNLLFQIMVMLMLYRIFTTGLEGADFHLIYPWMPPHPQHFNLMFLGKFDLAQPNMTLNWINAGVLLAAEFLSGILSPFPTGRYELMSLIVLPLGAFTFFAFMPAGKKLFVITTLLFTIGIMLVKLVKVFYYESRNRLKKVAYSLILDKPEKDQNGV